jgi:hypothetical protein
MAAALTGTDAPTALRGGGARGGSALDGGDSPDRRGCASGWVDGDRGLYSRRDSPSLDRYHDHHEI